MQRIGMSMILNGLYIGGYRDSRDEAQLTTNGVTHIISLLMFAKPFFVNRHYLCIQVSDTMQQNISQYFEICNDFIHRARLEDTENNNVLIHCYQGYSRSASVAIAYIMSVAGLTFDDAWKVVRLLRVGARPNLVFQLQLQEFERSRVVSERWRIRQFFPNTQFQTLDLIRCRSVLDNSENLLQQPLGFWDESNNDFGLTSASGTEQYSVPVHQPNTENDEQPSIEEEHGSERSRHQEKNEIDNKVVKAFRLLRELRDLEGQVDMSKFEQKILMPNAIYYRPIRQSQESQGRENANHND